MGTALLFVATLVPLVLLGLNVWPAADDYGNWNSVARFSSPPEYAWWRYVVWSGRLLFELTAGFVFAHPDWHEPFSLIPPLAFGSTPLALLSGLRNVGLCAGRTSGLMAAALGLAAMWFGLAPYLAECVFWLTGGLQYAGVLALSALWLAGLFSIRTLGRPRLLLLAACGMILGTGHEQLSAGLVVAVLVYAVLYRVQPATLATVLLPLLVGTLALYLAPGNFARAGSAGQVPTVSPSGLITNYLMLAPLVGGRLIGPLLAGAVVGALCGTFVGRNSAPRRPLLAWSLILLSASVGSTLPLSSVPGFAGDGRTGFFPAAFALFGAAGLGAASSVNLRHPSLRLLRSSVAAFVILAYARVAVDQVAMAFAARPELVERFQLLAHAEPTADIALPRLTLPTPNVVRTPELSEDPAYWENVAAATFFRVRSVTGHLGADLAQSQ